MKTDEIFRTATARPAGFEFNKEVAQVFDDMLVRSIPMYTDQQRMVRDLAAEFWIPATNIYDLGCSTATTLINIARVVPGPCRLIGFDSSLPMIEEARAKIRNEGLAERITLECVDLNAEPMVSGLENASVVILCWTLQFVSPGNRERLMRWVYDGLVEGGILIMTEKILAADQDVNGFFVDSYHGFKKRNDYSAEEILRKREALENVLIPYSAAQNADLFRKSGFQTVETFFQWYNFAGYIGRKTPAAAK